MPSAVSSAARALEPLATSILGSGPALALARGWRRRGYAVLCYHRLREPTAFDDPTFVISPERFREHVEVLSRLGQVVGLDDLAASGTPSDRPRVVITFDDGYREVLDHALPVLAEYGCPSVLYCCSEVVAGERAFWWDRLESSLRAAPPGPVDLSARDGSELRLELDGDAGRAATLARLREHCTLQPDPRTAGEHLLEQLPAADLPDDLYLDVEGLARAESLGAEIGSHSRRHSRLGALPASELDEELRESRAALDAWTSRSVRSVAYPHGDPSSVNEVVFHAARTAGYETGFTIRPALARPGDDPFSIPRITMYATDTARRCAAKGLGALPGVYDRVYRRTERPR